MTGQEAASPADIRAMGWTVAVHNDYRLNGEPHTFWLFTKGDRCVKGEGETDAEALNAVRTALKAYTRALPTPPVVLRCAYTDNPCGTDTRAVDSPCMCQACRTWSYMERLRTRIAELEVERKRWEYHVDC